MELSTVLVKKARPLSDAYAEAIRKIDLLNIKIAAQVEKIVMLQEENRELRRRCQELGHRIERRSESSAQSQKIQVLTARICELEAEIESLRKVPTQMYNNMMEKGFQDTIIRIGKLIDEWSRKS